MRFISQHQCNVRTLAAFEKSEYPEDWRELMRLYLVRRTRTFIQINYAQTDPGSGRKFLTLEDGSRSYFPARVPRTVAFPIDENDPDDQYARLYAPAVVDVINKLCLPRYGLGNYIASRPVPPPTAVENVAIQNLSRAGKRLMGFCRTNLFKRLESSGQVFIQSVERHILRNYIFLCAIEAGKPLPLGTQDASLLDTRYQDEDEDLSDAVEQLDLDVDEDGGESGDMRPQGLRTEADFRQRAAEVYAEYEAQYRRRFKWLRSSLFDARLTADLRGDAEALLRLLQDCRCHEWDPANDAKLNALHTLLAQTHPDDKVLVFSQFADTVRYLEAQLQARGLKGLAGATGDSPDPTAIAWRFSPESNEKRDEVSPGAELRVVIATDVLSEGQNLQDAWIVVNYDLPWAIIRLIQRAGRVDRIGQRAERIVCYSFLPAEGVERIIRLRGRVRQRLAQNAEVLGADEAFFEDDRNDQAIIDLYNERSGLLDSDADEEVDLSSYAYQIWQNAIAADPSLARTIPNLPPVAFSARAHIPAPAAPPGALLFVRTGEGNDAMAWVDEQGEPVSESEYTILRAAECAPDTPALPRPENHHDLVARGVRYVAEAERSVGGALGRPSGARYKTYARLMAYADRMRGTLFDSADLNRVLDDIYRYPLRESAKETLNRQLRAGISDDDLAELAVALRNEDRLCLITEEAEEREPQIICSLGLVGQ